MKRPNARRLRLPGVKIAVLLALLAAGPVPQGWAGEAVTLTLEDAVRLARTNNPDLINAQQEQEAASARIAEARSGAYPGLNLNVGYTRNWIQQSSVITVEGEDDEGNPVENTQTLTFGHPNQFTAGLSVQQSLYAGGKVRNALDAAKIYSDQVHENVRTAEKEVCYQVRRGFLGILMAGEAIDVAQMALDQARANLKQVQSRYNQGVASEFDFLRAQVQAANLQPPLIEAKNAYQRATEQLKHVIGLDMAQTWAVSGDLRTIAENLTAQVTRRFSLSEETDATSGKAQPFDFRIDLDRAVALALKERPELRTLDFQANLLEKQMAVARGDKRPSIALFGSYGLQWQLPDEWRMRGEDVTDSWLTGVTMTLSLFDGGRTRARVDQAKTARYQVQTQRKKLADGIYLEVKNALLDLREAQEKTAAQKQTIGQAERGLSIAEVRFSSGMATQLEVLDAQLALTTARTQYIRALHDYAVALVTLEHAIGYAGIPSSR